jgi:signal transduction histidine kinase
MKSFNRIFAIIISIIIIIFIIINGVLYTTLSKKNIPLYKVEINRVWQEISDLNNDNINLSEYSYIKSVTELGSTISDEYLSKRDDSEYMINKINNSYYRIDYTTELSNNINIIKMVNIPLFIMIVVIIILLLFLRTKILKPFNNIRDIPFELSKGNLVSGLKENKSKFFGKFVWGLDLLREHLEEQRIKELSLQKDKKTLVLSISHDIKTPLSAIKLYSKSLSKNLYKDNDKIIEVAENINSKADEIENFVSQIIKASSEDFLNLEVSLSEFYLKDLIERLNNYYSEKLSILNIDWHIGDYNNCLISGDIERSLEVLQNIVENAIKYGDGNLISLNISSEENCQLISISNSGNNISKNELPHIFDSFWRGSNVKSVNGSGLGLYICRDLMKKMDGEIFAEIENDKFKVTCVFRIS